MYGKLKTCIMMMIYQLFYVIRNLLTYLEFLKASYVHYFCYCSFTYLFFMYHFCLHLSQPYLYTLVVVLKDRSGRVVDCESCPVGFRKVSKAHKQLLVNGHAVVIRGVNRHEHHPQVGKANIESCMIKVLLILFHP